MNMKLTANDHLIEEKILSEERVFEGKVVKVGVMQVTLPDGKPALREAVRHMGASAVVAVDDEGNVILVRQFRSALARVLMEIPAGKLDYKGEDRLEAAKRELREETGLLADNWVHLTDAVSAPGFCDEVISIYLATGLTVGEDEPDEDEFLNVIRLPMGELLDMAQRGEITDSKTLIGLLLAHRHLSA